MFLTDLITIFEARARDKKRKMESLAVSQKAKNDYKARMQTWTEAAKIIKERIQIEAAFEAAEILDNMIWEPNK